MRPRIKHQLCSVNNQVLIFTEPKELREKAIRRQNFEKDYNKKQKLFSGIQVNEQLTLFSNTIAEQIKQFKQSRI